MVTALPQSAQLKLNQTLAQWHQWRTDVPLLGKPEIVEVMGQGLSNYSIRVAADQEYVVRIDGVATTQHALNRQIEWRALHNAWEKQLAPRPCYFNPELGSLVCSYLPPDVGQPQSPAQLAALLREIHSLPALHQRLDLMDRLTRYEHQVSQHQSALWPEVQSVQARIHVIAHTLAERQEPLVCCHNDLLRVNRVVSAGRLWAVDWEYCAMGSAWFDLAASCCGDNLDDSEVDTILREYLQSDIEDSKQIFTAYSGLYRYLEILWFAS